MEKKILLQFLFIFSLIILAYCVGKCEDKKVYADLSGKHWVGVEDELYVITQSIVVKHRALIINDSLLFMVGSVQRELNFLILDNYLRQNDLIIKNAGADTIWVVRDEKIEKFRLVH